MLLLRRRSDPHYDPPLLGADEFRELDQATSRVRTYPSHAHIQQGTPISLE